MDESNVISFENVKYAYAAAQMSGDANAKRYIPGAFNLLAKDLGLSNEAMGFVRGAYTSDESIKVTLEVYLPAFNKSLGDVKVKDLANVWYHDVIEGMPEESQERVGVLADYDESFGEMRAAIARARHTLEDPDLSDEDREASQQVLQRYTSLSNVINELEGYKIEKLRASAVEESRVSSGLERRIA